MLLQYIIIYTIYISQIHAAIQCSAGKEELFYEDAEHMLLDWIFDDDGSFYGYFDDTNYDCYYSGCISVGEVMDTDPTTDPSLTMNMAVNISSFIEIEVVYHISVPDGVNNNCQSFYSMDNGISWNLIISSDNSNDGIIRQTLSETGSTFMLKLTTDSHNTDESACFWDEIRICGAKTAAATTTSLPDTTVYTTADTTADTTAPTLNCNYVSFVSIDFGDSGMIPISEWGTPIGVCEPQSETESMIYECKDDNSVALHFYNDSHECLGPNFHTFEGDKIDYSSSKCDAPSTCSYIQWAQMYRDNPCDLDPKNRNYNKSFATMLTGQCYQNNIITCNDEKFTIYYYLNENCLGESIEREYQKGCNNYHGNGVVFSEVICYSHELDFTTTAEDTTAATATSLPDTTVYTTADTTADTTQTTVTSENSNGSGAYKLIYTLIIINILFIGTN